MIDLDELERLDRERTQGKWSLCEQREAGTATIASDAEDLAKTCMGGSEGIANGLVIVAAINALPSLLRIARAAVAYERAVRKVGRGSEPADRALLEVVRQEAVR